MSRAGDSNKITRDYFEQELLNTKANGRLGFVTLGIAAVAFILSVLHFII
ncbi:MAG: hypothetical protein GX757_05210 [Clostridiales bacterium]|nr:hypothetical protein [Clostridiales bacterium]